MIVLAIIIFVVVVYGKKTISEDLNEGINAVNMIENTSRFIVGVSKDNIIATGETSVWGSGIIVSKQGLILTNSHVGGTKDSICYVVFDSKNYYEGKVVWSNEILDLSIVKLDLEFADCISIKEDNQIKVGQEVYGIGNPININFQKTVSKGIISGLNRNLEFDEQGEKFYMNNLIQTDAAINYGSSGGALVDENGNLIGVNTIKITDATLMGFAIPIDVVIPVIDKLEQNKNFEEARLKIWCYDKFYIDESNSTKKFDSGVMVAKIEENSNAEKAGLRVGDVIKYIDTNEINTVLGFKKSILERNIGDNVILKVERNNKEILINVELE